MKTGEIVEVLFQTGLDLTTISTKIGTIRKPGGTFINIANGDLSVEGDAADGNLLWTTTDSTFDETGAHPGFLTLTFSGGLKPKTETFIINVKGDYQYP